MLYNICRASSQKSQSQLFPSPPSAQKKKSTTIKLTEPRKTERDCHVSKNRDVSPVREAWISQRQPRGEVHPVCERTGPSAKGVRGTEGEFAR